MLVLLESYFSEPPSLQEVADQLNSTHQNVKTMASKLEREGFISFRRDCRDRRVLRLVTTEKNRRFWEENDADTREKIMEYLRVLNREEIVSLYRILVKLCDRAGELRNGELRTESKEIQ